MPRPHDDCTCSACRLYDTDPRYKRLYDSLPREPREPKDDPGPCLHLGDATGERRACPTCPKGPQGQDKTFAKIHRCAVHGACTLGKKIDGVACCDGCPDRAAAPPAAEPSVRHLLYHVYPRRGPVWRRNLLWLRERMGLFNGRRLVAVVTDGTTDPAAHVRDALDGTGCEIYELPNDPGRREGATFLTLFEGLVGLDGPEHCTLYAHAKGTTRPASSTAERWAEALAEVCLDYWPLVGRALARHPVAGAFKRPGRGWHPRESRSEWHYSGSWFWFRNRDLFSKPDWRRIDSFWGAIESYPSLHFRADEAACLFHEVRVKGAALYDHGYWDREVAPDLERFRLANAAHRAGPGVAAPAARLLNLGCGPFPARGWVNADVVRSAAIRPDVLVPAEGPLPFPAACFDRAYLGHVLEHVPWPRVPALLAEVRRVLAPGGLACVVGPDAVLALEARRRGRATDRQVWDILEDDRHRQHASPGDDWEGARHQWNCYGARVERALAAAGFLGVLAVPLEPAALPGWPVVDFTAPHQFAVTAANPALQP